MLLVRLSVRVRFLNCGSVWKRLAASRRGTHYVLWPYVLRRNRKRLFSIACQPRPAILYISTVLFERFRRDLPCEYMRARDALNQTHWSGRLSCSQINMITSPDNPLIRASIWSRRRETIAKSKVWNKTIVLQSRHISMPIIY